MSSSSSKKWPNVIEPNKSIIEDLEILAFETEEQLNYYTIWHEALVDKRRELNAETERERHIIHNEIARKTRQLISLAGKDDLKKSRKSVANGTSSRSAASKRASSGTATVSPTATNALAASRKVAARLLAANAVSFKPSKPTQQQPPIANQTNQSVPLRPSSRPNQSASVSHQRQGSASLPNGLTILNSAQMNSLSCNGKQLMKYKLTKLYNKYRGRQMRRNFVHEKQRNAMIEMEISKSYLNSWLAYTALQALRLPPTNNNKLSIPQQVLSLSAQSSDKSSKSPSTPKKNSNKQQANKETPQKPAMHLVYLDPGNIITYSNRVNPQQVAEYKRKSHLLPSSATSKKSSAASYDVYEIMEVLANTNKTNVTITRNANRPSTTGATPSIYSHSVNANTPGIVSTQLHLQARSYLDSMSKFYVEERQRLEQQQEEINNEPSIEATIARYLKLDDSNGGESSGDMNGEDQIGDDEFEKIEEDVIAMVDAHQKLMGAC